MPVCDKLIVIRELLTANPTVNCPSSCCWQPTSKTLQIPRSQARAETDQDQGPSL